MNKPSKPTLSRPSPAPVREVPILQAMHWLALGWRDMRRCGWLSLMHGLAIGGFGAALLLVAHDRFWLLAGAFSGFLVVAPVLATSLYAMSRALEHGRPVNWRLLRDTWLSWQQSRFADRGGYWCLVRFGLLLGLAGTGWVLTSAALITLLAPAPILQPVDFLRHVVLAPSAGVFMTWLALGGVLAAPIFASSVVAMPLLLDRRISVWGAVITSWDAVIANPVALALWAALLLLSVLAGFATLMVGLVVLLPVAGHASWHAYRDLVDASGLPGRPDAPGTP